MSVVFTALPQVAEKQSIIANEQQGVLQWTCWKRFMDKVASLTQLFQKKFFLWKYLALHSF